ncbi:MaoC family dehydratase N-terminal domain-containing protein [Pseudomonas sp. JQ170]|uniref:FAS1-like dehydratase domain-containing protein n=1 Tax=unclassified Pseudomonas TaxID=196821 RepID=UPI00264D8A0B|nr:MULTISPECIES: MaoC family dehydratase N-terminal domain-containing protein [unclassified Pseudomonas]MDN7140066.1 MaoC family dehydratase N-terminal domain-containing protein [Pseudomonas sp. JQ170]WRO78577.1 MaoC family dehydratase N-terminal domain-containing protein [Pseudomonas sp. 170C]
MSHVEPGQVSLEVGIYCDDLPVGTRFHSKKRTVTETDLVNFANLTWLTEELFTNAEPADRARMGISGRVVPGGLVYTFAEGLVAPSFQASGMAFLNAELNMQGPTFVGDTLQVRCEVIEQRISSRPDRGLVRTRNEVVNQRGETVMVYTPLRMMRVRPER